MMEIWKDIPWANGFYEVSNLGRVRSKQRIYMRGNGRQFTASARDVPTHWHDGYQRVRLNVPGFPKWHTVQKLVMETFEGPRPPGMLIRHLDGDSTHNAFSNLRYGTNAENQADRLAHGTANIHVASRVLNDSQIVEMRKRRAAGEGLKALSGDYGVTKSYVTQICTGKIAEHLPGPIVAPLPKGRKRSLTDAQIAEIIKRRSAGEKIVPLGREYGVCHSLISRIYRSYFDENRVIEAAE